MTKNGSSLSSSEDEGLDPKKETINHYFHGRHFRSVEAMFDPHENVDYAARFLRELE